YSYIKLLTINQSKSSPLALRLWGSLCFVDGKGNRFSHACQSPKEGFLTVRISSQHTNALYIIRLQLAPASIEEA
ncbi:MAG: hypothetical protein IJU72_03890, partial [Bacteroidales bacterium]|nr:hypothetical protein [Bacteroidales bacterium]